MSRSAGQNGSSNGQLTVSHYVQGASPYVPQRRPPWFHLRGATPVQLFVISTLACVLPANSLQVQGRQVTVAKFGRAGPMHRISLAASAFPDAASGSRLHDTNADQGKADLECTTFAIAPLVMAAMCTMPALAVAAEEGPGPFQTAPFSQDPFTWILYKLIYFFALSWPAGIPLYAAYKAEILPPPLQAWMVSPI